METLTYPVTDKIRQDAITAWEFIRISDQIDKRILQGLCGFVTHISKKANEQQIMFAFRQFIMSYNPIDRRLIVTWDNPIFALKQIMQEQGIRCNYRHRKSRLYFRLRGSGSDWSVHNVHLKAVQKLYPLAYITTCKHKAGMFDVTICVDW
jgi:hypothetical protein